MPGPIYSVLVLLIVLGLRNPKVTCQSTSASNENDTQATTTEQTLDSETVSPADVTPPDAAASPRKKGGGRGRSDEPDPDAFSQLTLKRVELLGSRWALEQETPIDVYHSIEIVDATLKIQNEMTLHVEFNLRQTWVAENLTFPKGLFKESDRPGAFLTAGEAVLAKMWSPDSYISTARESYLNTIKTPLSLVYIFPNRTIIFKVRMYTKVSCSSSFKSYPLDTQICHLDFESYKYDNTIVRYHWTNESLYRPVVIRPRRHFQYELQALTWDTDARSRGGRDVKYPFVRVEFKFERKLGNQIIQVYTPTTLVVVLSWFSFWLGLDAIPGRISLLVTCMLTLVTMHSGIKSSIPPVSYITLMDVWYVCCVGFVFVAVCEFVIVKYLHWRHQLKRRAQDRKFQKQARDALYTILRQQSAKSNATEEKNGQNHSRSRTAISFRNGAEDFLPVDKRTALASSYWMDLMDLQMQRQKELLPPSNLLQSILVEGRRATKGDYGTVVDGLDDQDESDQNEGQSETMAEDHDNSEDGASSKRAKKLKRLPLWITLDRVCRGLLPSLFLVFNGIYWPTLFYSCNHQERLYG